MIDQIDLTSLTTRVRDLVNEPTPVFWTDEALQRMIDQEIARLSRRIVDLNQGYLELSITLTPTSGSITLPTNVYVIRSVELASGSEWEPATWIDASRTYLYSSTSYTYAQPALRFEGNKIKLEPSSYSASQIRVRYGRIPASMREEAMLAASSSTFQLGSTASTINDVYNGDVGLIKDGTGIGQTFEITDYAGATQTATIDSWSGGTTPDTTSVYSLLLPYPLAQWSDLVVYGAAIRALTRRRDTDLTALLQKDYDRDFGEMIHSLSTRQVDQSKYVRYVPDHEGE